MPYAKVIKPEDVIIDPIGGRVLAHGKILTGSSMVSALKKYIIHHITRGKSLKDLGLSGEGSIPHRSEVYGWERIDPLFATKLGEAKAVRDQLNLEDYQSAMNELKELKARGIKDVKDNKELVDAIEKQVAAMEKYGKDAKPTHISLTVKRAFPENEWEFTQKEKVYLEERKRVGDAEHGKIN